MLKWKYKSKYVTVSKKWVYEKIMDNTGCSLRL